jgi:ribonuclease HI
MIYAFIALIAAAVFFAWAALKAQHEGNEKHDQILRDQYQHRNDVKGGTE